MSVVIKHPLSNGIFTVKHNNNNFTFTYNHLSIIDIKYKKYELKVNKETILNTNPLFQLDFNILYTIIEDIPKFINVIENRVIVLYEIYIVGNKYPIEFILPFVELTEKENILINTINTDYLLREIIELKKQLKLETDRTYYLIFHIIIFIGIVVSLQETIMMAL